MRAASLCFVGVFGLAGGAYAAGDSGAHQLTTNPCALTTSAVVTVTGRTTETLTTTVPTPTDISTTPTTTTPVTTTNTTPTTTTTVTTVTTTRTVTKSVPVPSVWTIPRHAKAVTREPGLTVVAVDDVAGPVRTSPNGHARVITHLRFYTPDQEALQTYLVIAKRTIHHRQWLLIDLPMRPNGTTGWIPRSYLGGFITSNTEIIVNRLARTLVLCRKGAIVYRTRVGVGRPTMPTPAGHFWVAESFASTDPEYGPWALGTSDYASLAAVAAGFQDGGMVGIHGTDEPWLIPGYPSHGCVRLHNANIEQLRKLVQIGTAIWIQ